MKVKDLLGLKYQSLPKGGLPILDINIAIGIGEIRGYNKLLNKEVDVKEVIKKILKEY